MFKKKDETKDYIFDACRVEICPNAEQQSQINRTFGCCRLVYNYFLGSRRDTYKVLGESMSFTDCNNKCNELKTRREYSFLKDVDKFALTNALLNLDDAYKNFFEGIKNGRRVGYSKFKSKKNPCKSYTTNYTNDNIKIVDGHIQLPKLGKVKISQPERIENLSGDIKSATISYTASGRYFVSVISELVVDKSEVKPLTKDEIIKLKGVGIDLGIKTLAVLSDGTVIENPKWYKKALVRLRKLQKKLSRMKKGFKNYEKQRLKLAKYHEYVANCRKDFMHKETTRIVDENQVICLEDLNVKGMVKNKKLARAISDASFGTFRTFIEYKAQKKHKIVAVVGRFYASSKICSKCDEKNPLLTLNERQWICPKCRTVHERDDNVSSNIFREGIRILCA